MFRTITGEFSVFVNLPHEKTFLSVMFETLLTVSASDWLSLLPVRRLHNQSDGAVDGAMLETEVRLHLSQHNQFKMSLLDKKKGPDPDIRQNRPPR